MSPLNNGRHLSASERRIADLERTKQEFVVLLNYLIVQNGGKYEMLAKDVRQIPLWIIRTEISGEGEERKMIFTRLEPPPQEPKIILPQ